MKIVDRAQLRGDRRPLLSTLWVFTLLNVLFRDFHELFRPGLLEQMIDGTVNGTRTTEAVILIGGVLIELPLLMVVLTRFLVPRIARIANVAVGLLAVPLLLSTGIRDLDDAFFAAVTAIAALTIVGLAWTWKPAPGEAGPAAPDAGAR